MLQLPSYIILDKHARRVHKLNARAARNVTFFVCVVDVVEDTHTLRITSPSLPAWLHT